MARGKTLFLGSKSGLAFMVVLAIFFTSIFNCLHLNCLYELKLNQKKLEIFSSELQEKNQQKIRGF